MVVGMDEVGRGALAGPVCVGAVGVDASTPSPPDGLDDSKALSPAARDRLARPLEGWGVARAVGWSSAAEIDSYGLTAALRRAGLRALDALANQLETQGREPHRRASAVVILDGSANWLQAPATLAEALDGVPDPWLDWTVVTQVKADATCASVAAASVIAKRTRDAHMVRLDADHPGFDWASNKGYGTAAHRDGLARLGPCDEHRRSWNLLGAA
jgi:ribonuclease HII